MTGARTTRARPIAVGLAMLLALGCGGARAQQSTPTGSVNAPAPVPATVSLDTAPNDLLTRSTMTGNWGGLRTALRARGYDFQAGYVGEYAYNFSGGTKIGGGLAQQFAVGATVDLARAFDLAGTVQVSFSSRQGRNASADFIGNKLAVQEVYGAGETFRLSEASYLRDFADKALSVKLGFYSMGNDFATTPILCSFQNTGFCSHAQSLPNNSGWSDAPTAKWGGRVRANLPSAVYLEVGVYDVNPTYNQRGNGLKIGLSGSTGALIPVELGKTVTLGGSNLPGHYKVGAYYDTSRVADVVDTGVDRSGRYGAYILVDQMVWRFGAGAERGLVLVADATVSDSATAVIPTYFVAAAVAQGPFAARPHDFIALGYIRAPVNRRTIDVTTAKLIAQGTSSPALDLGENVVELSYGLQATPWMLIHPNLQYIGNAGAFALKHTPEAWVFGLQTKLVF